MAQREPSEFQSSQAADKMLKGLKKAASRGKRIDPKMTARIAEVEAERDRLRAKGK